MPKLKTWLAAAGLLTLMACGGSETTPPEASETPQDAAAPAPSSDSAASTAFVRPEGLPETAIPVTDLEGRVYWVEARENGRVALYSFTEDGQAGATAGTFEQLQEAYPTLDLSPLAEQMDMAGEVAADEEAASGVDALRATRDGLVAATPGAQKALDLARNGPVLELTGPTLHHLVESMGGSFTMTKEELDALLKAQSDGRFTATHAELNALIKGSGEGRITEADIRLLLPKTLGAPPPKLDRDAPGKGRQTADCPGLVYGSGKREICLPLGEFSFADRVVSFTPGEKPSKAPFDFPGSALGAPNYRNTYSADFISLGCNGELVTQFTDNILIDVDGIDLYIFEIGPVVEKTTLAISSDGENWIEVGEIEGARSDVDIGPFVSKGDKFPFVRLTNASNACGGNHAGADIDAIAAVGAEIRLSLDSALLFDVGKFEIKPEAEAALSGLAAQLESYGADIRVTVEGHTDSTGSAASNQTLSENRAKSVWANLSGKISPVPQDVTIKGYGASRPVADNATEEGRAENRRVDILILPGKKGYLKE
ncbi:MAG: OmpA family protein [Hyphomonas sp.]|uniref:OmpA family protein n=1 Tax=Hyphomonas sp. TaxID=87 RepID=UPI001D4E5325|nr:OmpA family protein [Hyphomonas sp.]MBA4226797.1 OmpA family protein [Hyphomonas sp.]